MPCLSMSALQQHLDEEDMSTECKSEIMRDQNRMAQDYRLNWRLNKACSADIQRLCGGKCDAQSGQTCGGVVLQCLQVSKGILEMLVSLSQPGISANTGGAPRDLHRCY